MSESDDAADEQQDGSENSGGPTVLYCFVREALRQEDLEAIRDALDDAGYRMTTGEDGENIMVKRQDQGSAVDLESVLG